MMRYLLRLSAAERLICRIVADADGRERHAAAGDLLALLGNSGALQLAQRNEVTPHVAHALRDGLDPAGGANDWAAAHEDSVQKIRAYLRCADMLAERLGERAIGVVALKNVGIARSIYPCAGCCPMGDIDLLVARSDFRLAHEMMQQLGHQLKFRGALERNTVDWAEKSGGAEYLVDFEGTSVWVEIQWRAIAGRWVSAGQEPESSELLERSTPIPESALRLLAPEDNLLQVALHTAKHTYVRAPGFRLHTDVDRIVRRQAIDWGIFVERVKRLHVRTPVFLSLVLPAMMFGTPVPPEVLGAISPPSWKARLLLEWLQRAGLFDPHEHKFGRAGYMAFNALLYDNLATLGRALMPTREDLQRQARMTEGDGLALARVRRLWDLLVRRQKT